MKNIKINDWYVDSKTNCLSAYKNDATQIHLYANIDNVIYSPNIDLVEYAIYDLKIKPICVINVNPSNVFDEDDYNNMVTQILAYKNLGVTKFEFMLLRNNQIDDISFNLFIDALEGCSYGYFLDIKQINDLQKNLLKLQKLKCNWVSLKDDNKQINHANLEFIINNLKNTNILIDSNANIFHDKLQRFEIK